MFPFGKGNIDGDTKESRRIIGDLERVDRIQLFTASSHIRTTNESTRNHLDKGFGLGEAGGPSHTE